MKDRKTFSLLVLIILLGAFLRFHSIGKESFWLDEGYTALAIKKFDVNSLIRNSVERGQIIPDDRYSYNSEVPAYFILLESWSKVFGISEFSLRSFSAMFGVLSLIAVFYLANYLFDKKIALISTLLASINLTLIYYSQEARNYSYLLFLSLISIILLLKSLKDGKIKHIVGLVVVNALIIYSHLPWMIFMVFEGIYVLYVIYNEYSNKKKINAKNVNILIAFFIMALLYMPMAGRILFSKDNMTAYAPKVDLRGIAELGIRLSVWLYPSEAMRQKIYDHSFSFSLFEWLLLGSTLLLALILCLLFLFGITKVFYKKVSAKFLILMFLFPLLFSVVFTLINPRLGIFNIKQVIYIIPAFVIISSVGISKIKKFKALIAIIIILSLLPLYSYYHNVDKQQFREAVSFFPDNETVFITKESATKPVRYYYGEKKNVIGIFGLDDLKDYLKDEDKFWVLFTFTKYSDPEGKISDYLGKNYKIIEKKQLFDIELVHYKK